MRKIIPAIAILAAAAILTACTSQGQTQDPGQSGDTTTQNPLADPTQSATYAQDLSAYDLTFSKRDLDASYTASEASSIVFSQQQVTAPASVTVSGTAVTVTEAGTYILSGMCDNGSVTVQAGEDAKIQLVLDGLTLRSGNGPAIYVQSADKVFLTLADGTESFLSDSTSYPESDSADGVIFSRADLTVNGGGSLCVTGNYKHGIVGNDELNVTGGKITVTAQNVALSGKDCVRICQGELVLNAGTDGIRSARDDNETWGFVYVESGKISITSGNDAIQAQTALVVAGGEIDVTAGGGAGEVKAAVGGDRNFGGFGTGSSQSTDTESAKGLKSAGNLWILSGSVTANTADDAIHANGSITVSDGTLALRSGDDGIHADNAVCVSGGKVTVMQSYEGVEGKTIILSGGNVSVTASDDGLNATDGSAGGMMGRPGQGGASDCSLQISGGYHVICAEGDGLDSNGVLTVSGGVTLISGPVNSGNGAIDYEMSGNVTGGTVIALGSSGMAMNFSAAQNQSSLLYNLPTACNAGTVFAVADADGAVIASFTAPKSFQSVVVTCPKLQSGKTYSLLSASSVTNCDANGFTQNGKAENATVLATVEITSALYSNGGNGFGGGGMHGGNKPQRPSGADVTMPQNGDLPQNPGEGDMGQMQRSDPMQ